MTQPFLKLPAFFDRDITAHHVVGKGSQTPEVRRPAVARVVVNLRGHVVDSTTPGPALVVGRFNL